MKKTLDKIPKKELLYTYSRGIGQLLDYAINADNLAWVLIFKAGLYPLFYWYFRQAAANFSS